jgi:diacylglycerol kinase (ATP)
MHIVVGLGNVRRTRRAAARVATAAAASGWTPEVIELADVARRAPEMTRLVLCGGDGLVHRAVQLVAGTPVEVAVVPAGTGNDLARALGIGSSTIGVDVAVAAPGTSSVRPIDLIAAHRPDGSVGYATTVLTAGYSGRVALTANAMRFPPGSAKYTVAALREIGRLRPRRMRLTVESADGGQEVIDVPITLVAIGNTSDFGGGMRICPDADPADGLLELVTVGALRRCDLVRWLPKVFRGRHLAHPAVTATTVATVGIETDESLWADGEPIADRGPLTVRVAKGALRVVMPG